MMVRSPYQFSALVEILQRVTLSSVEEVVPELADKVYSGLMVAVQLPFPLDDTLPECLPKAQLLV